MSGAAVGCGRWGFGTRNGLIWRTVLLRYTQSSDHCRCTSGRIASRGAGHGSATAADARLGLHLAGAEGTGRLPRTRDWTRIPIRLRYQPMSPASWGATITIIEFTNEAGAVHPTPHGSTVCFSPTAQMVRVGLTHGNNAWWWGRRGRAMGVRMERLI